MAGAANPAAAGGATSAAPSGGPGLKGGGQTAVAMGPTFTAARAPQMGGSMQPNVFGQAASNLGAASSAARGVAGFTPANVAAQTAVGGINTYMNPYTQQVIDRTQADIARQQELAMNQLGAQASAAGAFGGSRHGVAEGVLGGEYGRAFGDIAAQQRQAGFNTALGASQQDVSNQMQASLANQQAAQQAAALRLQAANQMGNLAQTGFGFGQQIGQQQMQQGAMQQMLNQQLIDAARGQYAGFTGAPQQSLGLPMAAVGAGNMGQQTQTQTRKPGLFDFLSLGASVAGGFSDRRLKTNIQPLGERNGVKLYSWDWNDEGTRLADPAQPTVGVIADELMQTHPHLVHRGADGYLRVDYSGLPI